MTVLTFDNVDLDNKKVLIRQDLNVPVKDGKVSSDARIRASIPTLERALKAGAKVMVMSHLGRPTEGEANPEFSLKPVAEHLRTLLDSPVNFVENWIDGVEASAGTVTVLENVRFLKGEKKNDADLAKKMAALCDVYVMDAFGTAHRAQASTHGVAEYAPVACAGPLLQGELNALGKALNEPARPMVAIVGGSKVSTKLTVLEALSEKVDQLIVGGGIANTFIAAQGHVVCKSLCEEDLIQTAQTLTQQAQANNGDIPVPSDVVCGKEFSESAAAELKSVNEVAADDMIFDIGPESAQQLADIIMKAGTVVWNGPVGVFEFDQFGEGTKVIANAVADSKAFSIAGGGDTLAAVDKYNIADKVSYISTGGGAFLEFLEGKKLPAVDILEKRAKQ